MDGHHPPHATVDGKKLHLAIQIKIGTPKMGGFLLVPLEAKLKGYPQRSPPIGGFPKSCKGNVGHLVICLALRLLHSQCSGNSAADLWIVERERESKLGHWKDHVMSFPFRGNRVANQWPSGHIRATPRAMKLP